MPLTGEDVEHLAARRMSSMRLTGEPFGDPVDTVSGMLGVQCQDYAPSLWSIAQRCGAKSGRTADVESAYDAGRLIRTHVLRPTWHFVAAEDLRWLLDLTSPRVLAAVAAAERDRGLDGATLDRSMTSITNALSGRELTRAQIGEALTADGVADAAGERLGSIVMRAELTGLVCSGRMQGRQQTYALLDERVAPASGPPDPMVELAVRYFAGHGPATIKDLAWWSSLRVTDLREAVDGAGDRLVRESIGDIEFFSSPQVRRDIDGMSRIHLIHTYDECVVGFSESKFVFDPTQRAKALDGRPGYFVPLVLRDGIAAGRWKRTLNKSFVAIDVKLIDQWPRRDLQALQAEAERHGAALGLRARVTAGVDVRGPLDSAVEFLFAGDR